MSIEMMAPEQVLFSLFIGRKDDYAYQRDNGRYVRARRPVMEEVVWRHLHDGHTIGTYVMDEQGNCSFAVFDADQSDGLALLAQVQEWLAVDGIPSYLERSRRGGHLWVLFAAPLPASLVRRWLRRYCPKKIEFYPKQDRSLGPGSLIRVPLGLHQVSGQRYPFLVWNQWNHLVPVSHSVRETLQWLAVQERAMPETAEESAPEAPPATHTYMTFSRPAPLSPGYATIADWCAGQDPFELIGRYVALDERGSGCCPFGEHHDDGRDAHPSFFVYHPRTPGGACWHCHTWGKGGSVFDFLRMWHQVDARTLWRSIRAGEVL